MNSEYSKLARLNRIRSRREQTAEIQPEKSKDSFSERFEGLKSSMDHSRNRLLFFVAFCIYSLVSIFGTLDKMLFMEVGPKIPLFNIELPLLAFYLLMPVLVVALHFNLLYTYKAHRKLLLKTEKEESKLLQLLPWGLYESALLTRESALGMIIYPVMMALLYLLAPLVLFAVWFRFADYQSLPITTVHLVLFGISVLIPLLFFRRLLHSVKSYPGWWQKIRLFFSLLWVVIFSSSIYLYHSMVIVQVSKEDFELEAFGNNKDEVDIYIYEVFSWVQDNLSFFKTDWIRCFVFPQLEEMKYSSFERDEYWFFPKITLEGETLVEADKNLLEMVREFREKRTVEEEFKEDLKKSEEKSKKTKEKEETQNESSDSSKKKPFFSENPLLFYEEPLFYYLPPTDYSKRHFRLAELKNCIFPRANFSESSFQKANLQGSELQYTNLKNTQLQGADLRSAQLQGMQTIPLDRYTSSFANAEWQPADFSGLSAKKLDEESVQHIEKILVELMPTDEKERQEKRGLVSRLNNAINRINGAADKTSREWVQQQIQKLSDDEKPNTCVLSEEMFNKIAASVTEPKARKRMGLPPLENTDQK